MTTLPARYAMMAAAMLAAATSLNTTADNARVGSMNIPTLNQSATAAVVTESAVGSPQLIELATFRVVAGTNTVTVTWQTVFEFNNAGFELQRSGANDTGSFKPIASYLTEPKLVGGGTSSTARDYSYVDSDPSLTQGLYCYRLVDIATNGERKQHQTQCISFGNASSVHTDKMSLTGIGSVRLKAITPNPASTVMQVSYTLPSTMSVSVEIIATDGRLVSTPVNAELREGGSHSERIAVDGLQPGVYALRLVAGAEAVVEKLIVVR